MAKRFVTQHPFLMELYDKIKAELSQWNPSFFETALLTVMIFINCYSGNDPTMANIQEQASNALKMNLWKLSNGDLLHFERLRLRFDNMLKLLRLVKFGLLSALKQNSKNCHVFANLYASMQLSYLQAVNFIEANGLQTSIAKEKQNKSHFETNLSCTKTY